MVYKILVLYAEVMPYNVVCFEALLKYYPKSEITVVHYGADKKLSGYVVPENININYILESEINYRQLENLYLTFKPDLILTSGRMVSNYLKLCRKAINDSVITVGNSDNHYNGTLRQKIALIFSYLLYRRYFNYMLVPGMPQYEYCRRLGFSKKQIKFPQYCANDRLFNKAYEKRQNNPEIKSGILFLGRLEKIKGIDRLLKIHKELYQSMLIKDKLIVVGSGSLEKQLNLDYDGVEHHSFMEQEKILNFMSTVKYFMLPSLGEAWGVVVHEAVCAGLPVVTSYQCGAATAFLRPGYNGYLLDPFNDSDIKRIMLKMNSKTQEELKLMELGSFKLSQTYTPKMWADSLINCIK